MVPPKVSVASASFIFQSIYLFQSLTPCLAYPFASQRSQLMLLSSTKRTKQHHSDSLLHVCVLSNTHLHAQVGSVQLQLSTKLSSGPSWFDLLVCVFGWVEVGWVIGMTVGS